VVLLADHPGRVELRGAHVHVGIFDVTRADRVPIKGDHFGAVDGLQGVHVATSGDLVGTAVSIVRDMQDFVLDTQVERQDLAFRP
jgi:hypothetical protein